MGNPLASRLSGLTFNTQPRLEGKKLVFLLAPSFFSADVLTPGGSIRQFKPWSRSYVGKLVVTY